MPEWQDITDDEFEAANLAGQDARARGYAVSARYYATGRRLSVHLSTGAALIVPVDLIEGLAGATDDELRDLLLNPGGLGLHFPQLDADVSVSGLLDGVFGSRGWMAQSLGRAGGAMRTDRKAAAARENGRRGGRPRKTPVAPRAVRYVQQHMSGDGAIAITVQEDGNAYEPITAARALEGLLSGEFRVLPSDHPTAALFRPSPDIAAASLPKPEKPTEDTELYDRIRDLVDEVEKERNARMHTRSLEESDVDTEAARGKAAASPRRRSIHTGKGKT